VPPRGGRPRARGCRRDWWAPRSSGGRELAERPGPADRLVHAPALVGVEGEAHLGADGRAGDPAAPYVVLEVGAHLELDLPESVGDRPDGEPAEPVVVVAEPARGGRAGRVAALQQAGPAAGGALSAAPEQVEGLLGGERVGDVTEVDLADQPFRFGVGEQLPQRLAGPPGGEVPDGVHDGADRHVHHPLLGAEPAQLTVGDQVPVERAGIRAQCFHPAAEDMAAQCVDGGDLDVVAPPDGEGEPVALVPVGGIGAQHDVGRRVVGVRFHGVGAVQLARGGKSDVVGVDR